MTYSFKVKSEMLSFKEDTCCKKAELYGFLIFSHAVSNGIISLTTTHREYIERYSRIIEKNCNASFEFVSLDGGRKLYETDENTLENVKRFIGCTSFEEIDTRVLDNDCCVSAFFRGAFIAGGFISDPSRTFHADISVNDEKIALQMSDLMEGRGLYPKKYRRNGKNVLYFKSADSICDLLAAMGLPEFSFELTNAGIEKYYRNIVNRQANCESANIDKTVIAAQKQYEAIAKLRNAGYPGMNEALTEVAEIRFSDVLLNLEEIGKKLSPPLSKAGVCHRMKKIISLADELPEND